MLGPPSLEELKKLESQIDEQLNGRDPESSDLEKALRALISRYSCEVIRRNSFHTNFPYKNKYYITPSWDAAVDSILAAVGFRPNAVDSILTAVDLRPNARYSEVIPPMGLFMPSFEAFLRDHPSRQEESTLNQQVSKINDSSQPDVSESCENPLSPLQSSLLEGFVGFKK